MTAIVAAYFVLHTDSVEHEAERFVDSICNDFFNVGSLQSINVLDSSGKPRSVSDLVNHKAEIALFTFRFTVTASDIDQRFPSTTLSLEFSLRLPQIFFPNCSAPAQDVSTITAQNTHTNTNGNGRRGRERNNTTRKIMTSITLR